MTSETRILEAINRQSDLTNSAQYHNKQLIQRDGIIIPARTKSGGTDIVLADLWLKVASDVPVKNNNEPVKLGISFNSWNKWMDSYLNDPRNGIKNNTKDRASARGNLSKEILKDKMTWKVFCKALRFINVIKFKVTIEPQWANGRTTSFSATVNIGPSFYKPEEEDTKDSKE